MGCRDGYNSPTHCSLLFRKSRLYRRHITFLYGIIIISNQQIVRLIEFLRDAFCKRIENLYSSSRERKRNISHFKPQNVEDFSAKAIVCCTVFSLYLSIVLLNTIQPCVILQFCIGYNRYRMDIIHTFRQRMMMIIIEITDDCSF